ncbi:hypothetical protein HQ545_00120 [Candidatus Woesearchaeota archaeon]|nr:hypothetical protein [Candidatus Woesearchaeota archaeon]
MDNILKYSLLAAWIIFLTMLVPTLNYMNASFGFWAWIAVGFASYHYLKSVKKPEKGFGLKIGIKAGLIAYFMIMVLILFSSFVFVTNFGTANDEQVQSMEFFLPKVYSMISFIKVLALGALMIFIPSVLTGYIVQLIHLNKGKVRPLKSYLVPFFFSLAAYSAVSAVMGAGAPGSSAILLLISVSIFAFHAIKYYNQVSEVPIKKIAGLFKFSLVFNLFLIFSISLLNRIFSVFGTPTPLIGGIPLTPVHLINELLGNAYLSIIIGYWIILIAVVAYHMSEKKVS